MADPICEDLRKIAIALREESKEQEKQLLTKAASVLLAAKALVLLRDKKRGWYAQQP